MFDILAIYCRRPDWIVDTVDSYNDYLLVQLWKEVFFYDFDQDAVANAESEFSIWKVYVVVCGKLFHDVTIAKTPF